jgi:hypothetical protein
MVVASAVDEASWPGTGLATTWEFPAARQTGLTPRVVVSNPGVDPVEVQVDVYSEDEWVEAARTVEVPPATPVSIPVGDLIGGVFGLRVRADQPVSAVLVAEDVGSAEEGDPAAAEDRIAGTVGAPTPLRRWLLPGPGALPAAASAVWLLNTGAERVTVTLQPLGIDTLPPQKVVVPANRISRIVLPQTGDVYGFEVSAPQPITAAWTVESGDGVAFVAGTGVEG